MGERTVEKLSETKTIAVPKDRQAELTKLYRRFLSEANRVDKLQVRRRQALANAADSLLNFMGETDKISGTPFDWEQSILLHFDRNKIVIQNPTLRPVSEQAQGTPYMETINKPPIFKGYSRATGEALCEFKFNGLTSEFEWFALVPEEKWSVKEAESVCRYLEYLNDNREELTRPVRIRPAE
jgi:hypothetical protein